MKETLIKCLDDLGITDSLNDQELFTLLRRFQVGNMYAYREVCDMLSHVYYAQLQYLNGGRRSKNESELQVLTHSPNHILTHSPNHLLTHSLTYSLTHLLT